MTHFSFRHQDGLRRFEEEGRPQEPYRFLEVQRLNLEEKLFIEVDFDDFTH